jgi:hypothetical protein
MIFQKKNHNAYPNQINLNSTSEPITINAADETTNEPVNCEWYLAADDRGSASFAGSLNQPMVNGFANVGIDPSDPVSVQNASVAVTGTSVTLYPTNSNLRNLSAKAKLVATSNGQTRELLLTIN